MGTLGNLEKGPSVLQRQRGLGQRLWAQGQIKERRERREREAFPGQCRVIPHCCCLESLDRVATIRKQSGRSSDCHQSPRLGQMEGTSLEDGQTQRSHTAGACVQAALGKVDVILVGSALTWTGPKLPVRSQAVTASKSRALMGKAASKSCHARHRGLCPREGGCG